MKRIHAEQGPRLTVDVSDQEKNLAKSTKKAFKGILKDLDDSLKLIYELQSAIVKQRPSREDLKTRYHGRLIRYRRKLAVSFNQLLLKLKAGLEALSDIMDPEMNTLKTIIMAEFDELSDGVESVLNLLDNADSDDFTKNLERLSTQMKRRRISINEIIDNQLFNHLENDILGRHKISELKTRIIKRSRLLRKY